MTIRPIVKSTLLASAVAFAFATPSVAQYSGLDQQATTSGPEEVIVEAPYFRENRGTVMGLPSKVSLSQNISYSDLNLRSAAGARELRARVRTAAAEVCDKLREAYPFHQQPGTTKCYQGALNAGLIRAEAAIRDARSNDYYRAGYRR